MELKYKKNYQTGALINKDIKGYNNYLDARKRIINQDNDRNRINRLERDISQIKGMLQKLLEK